MTYEELRNNMYCWGFSVGYAYSRDDMVSRENFKEYVLSRIESSIKMWEQEGTCETVAHLQAERELFLTLNEDQINECFEEFYKAISDGARA